METSGNKPSFNRLPFPNQASILIFGASGDLTKRMLIPALYHLYMKDQVPKYFQVIGSSRTELTHEIFREKMRKSVESIPSAEYSHERWQKFSRNLYYIPGDLTQEADYTSIDHFIKNNLPEESSSDNRLYYFAVAPQFHEILIDHLGNQGMATQENGWRRVIIEKPFGKDCASAQKLNADVHQSFN